MALTQTQQILAALPAGAGSPPSPPATPYLKAVEGLGYFQKTPRTQTGPPLTGSDLRFTYCDVTDYGNRPFGNLFPALRLPVTAAERANLGTAFAGTALAGLENLERMVVVEIPANDYGEMVDGKSIELRVPLTINGQNLVYTLYGGYYGFNTELNNQYSDTNTISSYLGVEATAQNDYNTNVAYLFCNEIQRPKDKVNQTQVSFESIVVPARGNRTSTLSLAAATTYRMTALVDSGLRLRVLVAGAGWFDLEAVTENGVRADGTFRLRQPVTQIQYFNDTYADIARDSIIFRYDIASSRSWNTWTPSNRYPSAANGVGKSVATLVDANKLGFADEPVGIAYLDKGLLVITHPLLVENLRRDSVAQCLNPADWKTLGPVPAGVGYAGLCYPGDTGTLASLSYRSVVTELTQTYTCMAGIGEFTQTTNPTYALAYPGSSTDQPVYITEIGLYNQYSELIAIAKTSEPLLKQANRPVLFTIYIRL